MIIVRIWEGLGNQLFQYAYARALEQRTGEKVYLDIERCFSDKLEGRKTCRKYQLDNFRVHVRKYPYTKKLYFFLRQGNVLEKIIFWGAERHIIPLRFLKEQDVSYKEELKTITNCCYVMGWFQNENYFCEYRELILKEFALKKKMYISPCLRLILRDENTVSLHVRRGDYKRWGNVLPINYYEHAINYIMENVENPYFLVFSDDVTWVKKNINIGERVIYVSEHEKLKDYEELILMSKCKHNIIANSTFSWWGAWLNQNEQKIVVGPKKWFSHKDRNVGYNIMPPEWIRV